MTKWLSTTMQWDRLTLWLAAMAVGLTVLMAGGPALHLHLGGWAFIAIFAVGSIGAFLAARIGALIDQRTALLVILLGAAAMRLALLFTEPTLSSDIYRYIWDGRVQAAGINPYRYVPAAAEVAPLRDAAIWPKINRADYAVTIYPPVAQMLFLGVTRLGESVVVVKLGLVLFEAATVAALIALLNRLSMPPARVAAYAWHPLPIWEIAGNGHVDGAMVALLILGLLVYFNGRTLLAGVMVTLGALVKPTALLALPVFWRSWDWKLPLVFFATIVAAYLPYLSVGGGVLGFLSGYIEEEGLGEGDGFRLVWLAHQLTGPLPLAGTVYAAFAALVLASMALIVGFRTDRSERAAIRALSWLLIVFLVLSTPHYPWYFLAVAPFLALYPTATAWTLTSVSVLLYYVYPDPTMPSYEMRFTAFTLATLAAFAYDLWAERRKMPGPVGEASSATLPARYCMSSGNLSRSSDLRLILGLAQPWLGATAMGLIGHLIPRQPVPDLSLPLAGGGSWRLSDQKPKHFTMLTFYRGVHCSICRAYLGQLQSMHAAFSKQGVTPIAISADTAERASSAEAGWGLEDLCIAYGLSLLQAREWGLYVSRGRGRSSMGIEEPPMFVEPALFLIRPDRTLYYASVQSMPFGRPCFEEMLPAIEKAVSRDYPARGEVAG